MKELGSYQRKAFLLEHPPVGKTVIIASTGEETTILAGTVLAKMADGKYSTTEGDADCILAEDVELQKEGDAYASVYVHASVLSSELIFEGNLTADEQKAVLEILRQKGIYSSEV